MIVKKLREMLNTVPEDVTEAEFDEMKVLIPLTDKFDGYWQPPCPEETGVCQLGLDEDGIKTEQAFVIVGHGFFDEQHGVPPELN